MWNGKDVSVVLMTYAERDSIREVIDGFLATGVVDEVVVVDNNAEPGTARGGGEDPRAAGPRAAPGLRARDAARPRRRRRAT